MNDKPVISKEAKKRILGFVEAVEALQETYGVGLSSDAGLLVIWDRRRTDQWIMSNGESYGEWDAFWPASDTEYPSVALADLEFEDFEGWDK